MEMKSTKQFCTATNSDYCCISKKTKLLSTKPGWLVFNPTAYSRQERA